MAAIDTLRAAAFGGIRFPFERRIINGGIRHHVHTFPHSPGGESEKMGRSLYQIDFVCHFHQRPGEDMDFLYQDLYPARLEQLRRMWEIQQTAPLVVPGLAEIPAFCTNWTQTLDARIASGEEITIRFLEDQDRTTVTNDFTPVTGQSLQAAFKPMIAPRPEMPWTPGLFDAIRELIDSIAFIGTSASLQFASFTNKLMALVSLCERADREVLELQDPLNHEALTALKDVWLQAQRWSDDIAMRATPIHTWQAPKTMSVADISAAIFGDASKVTDLLDLNAFTDPFAVPAGTVVRFYATS